MENGSAPRFVAPVRADCRQSALTINLVDLLTLSQ